jgi:hypothetical protein
MVNINIELDEGKAWSSVGVNKCSIFSAQEDVRLEIAGLGCLNAGLLWMRSGSLIGREK